MSAVLLDLDPVSARLDRATPLRLTGRVTRIGGVLVEGVVPGVHLGMVCRLGVGSGAVPAEVVAVRERTACLMPLGSVTGLAAGAPIVATPVEPRMHVSDALMGRVVDAFGEPIDGKGPLRHASGAGAAMLLDPPPLNPLTRGSVSRPLSVGVRALDGLLTCGEGQRLAILAGAGVGKSTLLGMMCRNTEADVTVIGLVGERSREVKRFVDHDLGPQGLSRAVLVSATSDMAPALRVRAAKVATAIAEWFRDQGLRVLLLLDSLSRVAMAQRELGLAVGEPPATKGYPPSAFAIIPRLLERAGPGVGKGSITALYTTLLEGDDLGDPVGDCVKSTTDGHIHLSRALADRGHFPAIDVLGSVSRVMPEVVDGCHVADAAVIRRLLADHRDVEELVSLGAYQRGASPRFDRALDAKADIDTLLVQSVDQPATFDESRRHAGEIAARHGGNR